MEIHIRVKPAASGPYYKTGWSEVYKAAAPAQGGRGFLSLGVLPTWAEKSSREVNVMRSDGGLWDTWEGASSSPSDS